MKKILLDGEIPVNCYLIEDQGKCYIVDPGFEKERLRQYVRAQNLEVIGILLTHAHFDHIGALDAFDVPIYIHENEYSILFDGYQNGFSFNNRSMDYEMEDLYVVKINEHTKIFLNRKEIEVIPTPGHTKGSVCYKYENQLITGDTLFQGSVGQWDFPTGDQRLLRESILKLTDSMDDELVVWPAHGGSTTIGHEKANNLFVGLWTASGDILRDYCIDYEAFQKARALLDNKSFMEARDILKKLFEKNDPNPLTFMYYQYAIEQTS